MNINLLNSESINTGFLIPALTVNSIHCVEIVFVRSFSGPYSVRMRENTDQKNSEYRHCDRMIEIHTFPVFLFFKLEKCWGSMRCNYFSDSRSINHNYISAI